MLKLKLIKYVVCAGLIVSLSGCFDEETQKRNLPLPCVNKILTPPEKDLIRKQILSMPKNMKAYKKMLNEYRKALVRDDGSHELLESYLLGVELMFNKELTKNREKLVFEFNKEKTRILNNIDNISKTDLPTLTKEYKSIKNHMVFIPIYKCYKTVLRDEIKNREEKK